MEKFRNQVKKTLMIYIAVLAVAVVLWVVFTALRIAGDESSSDFRTGACGGIITLMALNIVRYAAALKSDEELKKLYIASTDERARLIFEKSNSASFRTVIIVLGLSSMVASFYSETVFYTLIAVIFAIIFINAGFNFYYRRKF